MVKPITLYGHGAGPNPYKVAIFLEELGLPYETKFEGPNTLKKEPYVKVNPNGRVPAIEDPNTGITLWESGAIIEYLINEYDKDEKLHYKRSPEKYHTQQFLHYQMSGQGPYYGQYAWFSHFHPEKIASARDRYLKEIQRVMGVLDGQLKDREWLVGSHITYADLSFVPWDELVPWIFGDDKLDVAGQFPSYHAWMTKMKGRPAVKKVLEDRAKNMASGK
ncbi:MAG: hypothetical protein Q9160_002857 [Pyrenula sp. 1 TL-2023]